MANNTSQHILNAAATLLGFCLVVITSLHIANKTESYIIDELTSVIAVILTSSCLLSFLSIRSKNDIRQERLEKMADYLFLIALVGILIIILLVTMNFIN